MRASNSIGWAAMRWLICEYLLKGVFLGLLVLAALSATDVRSAGIVLILMVSGLGAGLAAAAFQRRRDGLAPGARPLAYLIVLLLENPICVYAGVIFGVALGALAIRPAGADWRLLVGCVGAGGLVGLGLLWLRTIPRAPLRWLAALIAGSALVAAVIVSLAEWPELIPDANRRGIGLFLLIGLPFFYLLTFVGSAEESEVEIAAWCATLGVAVWLINLTKGVPLLALALPAAIYYLYTRYVMPGLRTFKHALRGLNYARLGQYRIALESLHRAVELDPDHQLARATLWDVHRNLNTATIAGDPDLLQYIDPKLCLERVAAILLSDGPGAPLRAEAIHLLDLVERRDPASQPAVLYWRAVAATHARDFDAAANVLGRLLDPGAWPPKDAARREVLMHAWNLALVLHPELKRRAGAPQLELPGRRLEAIASVERALAVQPEDEMAWTLKRLLYSELTECDCDSGSAAEFDHAYAQQLGLALIGDAARWQRGVEYLRIAVRGLPEQGPSIWKLIGETYERAGLENDARAAYQRGKQAGLAFGPKALADDERHTFYALIKRLADDAVVRNDLDSAIADSQLYTGYERAGIETYRTLADLHERRGDALSALRVTEQALLYSGKDKDLLDRRDKYYYSVTPETLAAAPEAMRNAVNRQYCSAKARQLLDSRDADFEVIDWAEHLSALALALDPASIAGRVLLARAKLRRGERDAAVAILESVYEPKPESFAGDDDQEAWYLACRLLGDLYLRELDNPQRAAACFTAYRSSAKSGADTLYKLGEAYEQLGEKARAAKYYEQVTAYDAHPLASDAHDALRRLRA